MVVRTLPLMLVRQILGLVGLGPSPDEKDVEIAVLRHQLVVLRRQVARPRYTPTDRMVLASLAKLMSRERWALFLVTSATLLRWHRELVRRRWTYLSGGRPGRRALEPAAVELVQHIVPRNLNVFEWITFFRSRRQRTASSHGMLCFEPHRVRYHMGPLPLAR